MRVLVALVALLGVALARVDYTGHTVYRLQLAENQQDVYTTLRNMKRWSVDFWSHDGPVAAGSSVDIRVAPDVKQEVVQYLQRSNVNFSVMVEDVQQLINAEQDGIARAHATASQHNGPYPAYFNAYHNLADMNAWVASLVGNYSKMAKIVPVGTSYQGRSISAVVITSPKATPKTALYFEGGIHAREWVSHTTMCFLMYNLLTNYGTDPNVTRVVDNYIIHIVWAVNPDGYDYTWTGDRMWRKTRSPNSGSSCIGVDPNRNWDNHWCQQGADKDPCSDAYCGPKAFSESETRAVSSYIKAQGNIVSMIDFHSYSQLWMQPYGWTSQKTKDNAAQQKCGLAATAAIKKSHGKNYAEGSIYVIIYPASGSSADWAYDSANVKYPYGVELRDQGQYGFVLPPDQIVPTGEEILSAIVALADCIGTSL